MESSFSDFDISTVMSVLAKVDEASNTNSLPPVTPRTVWVPASSAESSYGSDGGPLLQPTSAFASDAAFFGHQSGQGLLPDQHDALAELALEQSINKAIEQELKRSLSPFIHFAIYVGETGPTTGYLFIIAHWVADHDGVLHRRQAVMAMCETEKDKVCGSILRRLKEVKRDWLSPLQLEVGYITTPTATVAFALDGACLGYIISPVHCFYQLMKGVMEEAKKKDFLIVRLLQTLYKISIHFEQSLTAHDRLKELQLQCGLPPEFLEEMMPKPSVNIFFLMQFLLARLPAVIAYQNETPEFNLTPWDWRLLDHLASLLKQCEDTMTTMRESATLGHVLHEFYLLEIKVKAYLQQLSLEKEPDVGASVTHFACELLQSLESQKLLEVVRGKILCQCAALLHPDFRDHVCEYLKEDGWQLKNRVKWQIEQEYTRNSSGHQGTPSPIEVAGQELRSYLRDNIDLNFPILQPLMYWYTKKHIWPSLSSLAFRYFSCPASPVFLEEVLHVEDLMISGRIQETLALNTLNRAWIGAEFTPPVLPQTLEDPWPRELQPPFEEANNWETLTEN